MTIQLYARSKARPDSSSFIVSNDEKFWFTGTVPGVRTWAATSAEGYRYTAGAPVQVNILLSGKKVTTALAQYQFAGKFEMNGAFQIRKYSDGRTVMWFFPSRASNTNRINVYNGRETSFNFSATTGPRDPSAGGQTSNFVLVSLTEGRAPAIAPRSWEVVATPETLAALREFYSKWKESPMNVYGPAYSGIPTVPTVVTDHGLEGPTIPPVPATPAAPVIPEPPEPPVVPATTESIGLIILVAGLIIIAGIAASG